MTRGGVVVVILFFWVCVLGSPSTYEFALLDSETELPNGGENITALQRRDLQMHTAIELAIDFINNHSLPILENTTITVNEKYTQYSPARGISEMINFALEGYSLVLGTPFSTIAEPTAYIGTVYDVAQLSPLGSSSNLGNRQIYPYFNRLGSGTPYTQMFKDVMLYYGGISGPGWDKVAIILKIFSFNNDLAETFIGICQPEIEVVSYQQYLPDELDLTVELTETVNSKARVILALIYSDWDNFILQANDFGLVGDNYAWFTSSTTVVLPFTEKLLTHGTVGSVYATIESPQLDAFLNLWETADPDKYPFAGPGTSPSSFAYRAFDTIIVAATALDALDKKGFLDGRRISASEWCDTIRDVKLDGVSGPIEFDETGTILVAYDLRYYSADTRSWEKAGIWSQQSGLEITSDVVWHSNTTEIPDLDVRDPFDYWSCHDREEGHDPTGKTISLHTPDSSDVDAIESHYHCDQFIDCKNMSDETTDCSTNYLIILILFGILSGILILLAVLLLIFVVIFGIILRYNRFKPLSPEFLVLVLLSIIIGVASNFAWFGKPHPIACGFQPWLLGLPTLSMIVALSVKNFRIWRIFKFPKGRITRITNIELFIYWVIVMLPALIILICWTIVSTPTASLETRNEEKHYICTTGGFTGPPGGLIFFFIFVGYSTVVLSFGALLSIAIRNIPSTFNESKLLTISIYNLGFLSIVIIPIYLVLQSSNPFIAWILRASSILYGFGATMVLQFLPIVITITVRDKFRNVRFVSQLGSSTPNGVVEAVQAARVQ